MIGDLVQQGVTQNDYSVTGALLVIGTFAILQTLVSYTSYRLPFCGPVLDGEPIVVVQDGKPIDENMKRERITLEEVMVAGPAAAGRLDRRRRLGRAGDERQDQHHPEAVARLA